MEMTRGQRMTNKRPYWQVAVSLLFSIAATVGFIPVSYTHLDVYKRHMAKLTIEVSAEEVEKALQAAYLKERSKISLPGFRKDVYKRQQ